MNLDPTWKYVVRVIKERKFIKGEEQLILLDKRLCTCKKDLEKTLRNLRKIYPANEFQVKVRINNTWKIMAV